MSSCVKRASYIPAFLSMLAIVLPTVGCSSQPWKISSVTPLEFPGNCFIGQGQFVVPKSQATPYWNGQAPPTVKCATASITVVPTNTNKPHPDRVRLFTVFQQRPGFGLNDSLWIANYEHAEAAMQNVFKIVVFISTAAAFEGAKQNNHGFPLTLGNDVEVSQRECRFFAGNNTIVCK